VLCDESLKVLSPASSLGELFSQGALFRLLGFVSPDGNAQLQRALSELETLLCGEATVGRICVLLRHLDASA
jgi:hypothetical protein